MKSLYQSASAVRKIFWDMPLNLKTNKIDHGVRVALAADIADELHEQDPEAALAVIEKELDHAKCQLKVSQEKEIFLGTRYRHYHKALDQQSIYLREEQYRLRQERDADTSRSVSGDESDDEEQLPTAEFLHLERRIRKLEDDEVALTMILEKHKEILAYCEEIRRKIIKLEKKRSAARKLATECQDFITASEKAEVVFSEAAEAAAQKTFEQEEAEAPAMEMNSLIPASSSAARASITNY